ncbi:protein-disulfide reductase DsbD domain-containing protein [Stappia indica]|uniref:protein-disulfide reductase DsbD domain-containing protein n=1 Tax=Stappia indica TaxID=538381 RepID=UPI000832037E|nr:protein-disulfide reductase DsbD domain-containing protein [Stappia indica]
MALRLWTGKAICANTSSPLTVKMEQFAGIAMQDRTFFASHRPRALARLALTGLVLAAAALGAPLGGSAHAGESPWVSVGAASVRLVSTGPDAANAGGTSASLDAALEIRLEDGWHTYWRFPGEAGIPTVADFAASSGLASARLRFPVPERYSDPYATSIVYHDRIVLPIDLEPAPGEAAPVLRAHVSFGVCREICMPGEAQLELPLGGGGPDFAARQAISAARAALPRPQGEAPPRISAIERKDLAPAQDKAPEETLVITAELASSTDPVDLFAEGLEGSYNGVPVLLERDGTTARFVLPARGLASSADGSRPLALTLVEGATAVEHRSDVPPAAN